MPEAAEGKGGKNKSTRHTFTSHKTQLPLQQGTSGHNPSHRTAHTQSYSRSRRDVPRRRIVISMTQTIRGSAPPVGTDSAKTVLPSTHSQVRHKAPHVLRIALPCKAASTSRLLPLRQRWAKTTYRHIHDPSIREFGAPCRPNFATNSFTEDASHHVEQKFHVL